MAEMAGLESILDVVIDYGATARHKPNPEPILVALRNLGEKPGPDCWYVGDTGQDALAATRAGVSFAWAKWGANCPEPLGTAMVLTNPVDLGRLRLSGARGD
jgi:phosphoglycolate phosphatase-like HAD superfamily hydrolase